MKTPTLSFIAIAFGLITLPACGHAPMPQGSSSNMPGSPEVSEQTGVKENAVLAGEWEYEEGGVVVPLRLDRYGNGTYDYKDGHFRTDLLSERRWAGAWAQRANDREGGFEITLSPDYSEGEGRWWYTRIEHDGTPNKPGGRFHVMKVQSTADNQAMDRFPR